jgi:sulfate adenylyltransferase
VVPVAVPLLPGDVDGDPLAAEVARRYAGEVGPWRVLPPATTGAAGGPGDGVPLPGPVARELARAVPPPGRRGVTVFFTGLSGSGKSTLAKALTARLLEDGRRTVTLLDGDEVRRLLSPGLGFSRADRDLNIRRIGFVVAEVTRHGGLAVCAPIAPFAEVRAQVRAAVEEVGDLVLVHVATPLAECERRDRKGLYARARRGEIPDFTGISSPYEEPVDADLVVDTTDRSVTACLDDVWGLLGARGYLG